MFSQFRQAVESFAPPPPRRGSQEMTRSGSPGPSSIPKSNSFPESRAPKSRLEERLRAKLAAAELPRSPSVPVPVTQHPLSPTSTPLPASPVISPVPTAAFEVYSPLNLSSTASPTIQSPLASPPLLAQEAPAYIIAPPVQTIAKEDDETDISEALSVPAKDITTTTAPAEPVSDQIDELGLHEEPSPSEVDPGDLDVEGLQTRLKLVGQRFTDVSTSFKRLQAEKLAADAVLRELTPVETMQDTDGLRDYLQNLGLKTEISQDEIKRLTGKLQRQDERIEELHDTHRLESASQSDLINNLRRQVAETDALLKASRSSTSQSEEESVKQNAEIERLHAEVAKAKGSAKEEEEKRVKAISLLKTVRQKLVKAEKDKEDAMRELNGIKDKEGAEWEKERAEKSRLQHEIDTVNAEREKAIVGLRAQFDKEVVALKDRNEKEMLALRGQFELEAITIKAAHLKELASKNSQILSLENSVNALSKEKNSIFDQLQLRQAELESSQFHAESLQSQNTELQYQLRESQDRIAALNEELVESRREQESNVRVPATSPEDVARLLAAAEAKHALKIADLKKDLAAVEKERNEGEADWSLKLRQKTKETDDLKQVLQSSAKIRGESEEVVRGLKEEIQRLGEEIGSYQRQISGLQLQADKVKEIEASANSRLSETQFRMTALEKQAEENKSREAQLRAHNKTLRDEMRKVQSSAALLERQRNPGVGYWTTRHENNSSLDINNNPSPSNSSEAISRPGSPRPSSSPSNDEEVNLEYLRNVILQFLEHKEMRPNLVKVLSIILHFTPQETRRLIAKV